MRLLFGAVQALDSGFLCPSGTAAPQNRPPEESVGHRRADPYEYFCCLLQ